MPSGSVGGPLVAGNDILARDIAARKTVPASYVVYKDGANYRAESLTGGTDYSDPDASTVIQNALNTLLTGGGSIFVKAGTYDILTTITLSNKCSLFGEGMGTIFKRTANGNLFENNNAAVKEILLRDFAIDMNLKTGTAITINNGASISVITMENLYIFNGDATTGAAITVPANNGPIRIRNVTVDRMRGGIIIDGTNSHSIIDSCRITKVTDTSLAMNPGALQDIIGHMTNNFIDNAGVTPITNAIFIQNSNRGFIFANNTLMNHSIGSGILANPSNWGVYTGNYVKSVAGAGLEISDGGNSTINGNLCEECGTGIDLNGSKNYVVANNVCRSTVAGSTGIKERGTADNNLLIGNRVIGNTTAITLVGTSTRAYNNPGFNPQGWATASPTIPASGVDETNTKGYPIFVYITGLGTGISAVGITDNAGTLQSFTRTGEVGDFYRLEPGDKIRLTYTGSPTWKWYGL